MKNSQTPAASRREHSGSLFAKIYNVFYCSKKAQQAKEQGNSNNDCQELDIAETDIDVVIGDSRTPSEVTDSRSDATDGRREASASCSDSSDPLRHWFRAVADSNLEELSLLLENKEVDIDTTDQHGWAGLHLACWTGDTTVVRCLLRYQVGINIPGPHGSTPLALAAQKGHLDICKLLLEDNRCEVNQSANLGDATGVTPLHLAAQNGHAPIVQLLIDQGATVNAQMAVRGIKSVTPLHLAVEANHMDVLDILIEAGCNVHQQTTGDSNV